MNEVKVEKQRLLGELEKNLDQHSRELEELKTERQKAVLNYFESEKQKVQSDSKYQPEIKSFPMPESHIKDYKKVIKMVEMSVENEIVLTDRQFSEYVMDDWNWKVGFNLTKSMYNIE